MAELPPPPRRPAPPPRKGAIGPRVVAALTLQREGHHLQVQRREAQLAVDAARWDHIRARRAVTAADVPVPAAVRTHAVDAARVLRDAVETLAALGGAIGTAGPSPVEVGVETQDGGATIVLRPHGDLDLLSSASFELACAAQLDAALPERLLVDLSGVAFVDSSGMAVLVEVRRMSAASDVAFAVTGLTPRIRRLFEITRLDAVFDLV